MFVVIAVWLVLMLALAAGGRRVRPVLRRVVGRLLGRVARLLGLARLRDQRRSATPVGRPIEAIARDAQRLGMLVHYPPPHLSFARFEGRRRAYDAVLGEACRALDLPHLLHVLPPGPDLDRERQRVESVLDWAGLRLDDAA